MISISRPCVNTLRFLRNCSARTCTALQVDRSAPACNGPQRHHGTSSNSNHSSDVAASETGRKKTGFGMGQITDQMLPTLKTSKLFQHSKYPRTATIIGAPMTYGQPFVGTDHGPQLLRDKGLRGMLTSLGWRVEDLPDLSYDDIIASIGSGTADPPNARNCQLVGSGAELLRNKVSETLNEGRFPLILGGDHSIGAGSLAGILEVQPNTGVIWVDAHADLNTPATSGSGNMHGMPIGLLLDHAKYQPETAVNFDELPGFEFLKDGPRLAPDQIVYVGLRDVDPTEREWINNLGIKAYTMFDIDRHGIGAVMDQAFSDLLSKDPNRPLHLSYDIDAIDPILAPATGTTVRGGLTYREAHFVAEAVAQTGNLASAEIVELNPTLSDDDGAEDTIELGLQIITSFMGKSII
eukprot:CAMPEP_0119551072 /NCGR_PEP_ID=MMETSP1352-20130426/4445_1 /TAXON_ID=265584 /ORGANISM="Stauroneis constricta, Strain CCMP1120" /LENGTH=408 /DNA_ID=CAMNT_0007597081 /DNA_START=38 /DNA_END=1264 /DNA_ORIENTATION=+